MPIYEFDCNACEHQFEELVRSTQQEESVACPACGSRKIQRRPSVFAARGAAPAATLPRAGGCGRCGDPNGSCSAN
ncbi:MAG: FmdB family zinc ribbon protein [Phycisphaerae bacterium]